MKPIRIFRHVDCEGPGYLLDVLQPHGIAYEIIAIDADAPIPKQIDDVSGLLFLGGGMSVNDDYPWIKQELALIRKAHEQGLPVMGVCMGGQLISKALGGAVTKGENMEVGWANIHKLDVADQVDWFEQLPDTFIGFHWHGETFSLPAGATALLRSDCYANQAFALGNTLALQFHLEMQASMVQEWLKQFYCEVNDSGPCVQSESEILSNLDDNIAALNFVADKIFNQWINRLT